MVELVSIGGVCSLSDKLKFRESLEADVVQSRPGSYVKLNGSSFRLNSHKGLISLREACSDDSGLN